MMRKLPARLFAALMSLPLCSVATARAEEAPEPPSASENRTRMPPFAVRVDPLTTALQGRLFVELEVKAWRFVTVELVPGFVVFRQPLVLNNAGNKDHVLQHSNGPGPLSGASLGASFWLGGEALKGLVLRTRFTNYGYDYSADWTPDAALGTRDHDTVSHTERRVVVMFGSQNRLGPVTLGGGFGLGYELNQQERCYESRFADAEPASPVTRGCDRRLELALDQTARDRWNLNDATHPLYISGTISVGVVFD